MGLNNLKIKKTIIFLIFIFLMSLINALDSETVFSCGGDSETVFSCDFGDTQNYITINTPLLGVLAKHKTLEFYTNFTLEFVVFYILFPFIIIVLITLNLLKSKKEKIYKQKY